MLFPDVAEWLALALAVTPQTPMAELRAASRRMWQLFRAMDATRQELALRELDGAAKRGVKRDIA